MIPLFYYVVSIVRYLAIKFLSDFGHFFSESFYISFDRSE